MSEKKKKIIILGIFVIFIISGIIYNTIQKRELYENLMLTKGTVVDFTFSNNNYMLQYKYVVSGKVYRNTESMDYFRCLDGTPGCKGKKFVVKYSSKNPNNSKIDLGKFNKHKLKSPSF